MSDDPFKAMQRRLAGSSGVHSDTRLQRLRHAGLGRWGLSLVVLLAVVVALFWSCGGGDDDSTDRLETTSSDDIRTETVTSDDAAAAEVEAAAVSSDARSSGSSTGTALAAPTALTAADFGRDIVYTAQITVQAEDVTAASREAVAIVASVGGVVFAQTTRTDPEPRAEVTFKVLPKDFSWTLERLSGVGELVNQSISADDVTGQIVDLHSRITTAELSVERLRRFLEDSTGLDQVVRMEQQLLTRETVLEQMNGELRALQSLVDLATIVLVVEQSPTVLPDTGIRAKAWVSNDEDDPCLGSERLTAEPDDAVFLCLEVENTGASPLTEVRVRFENLPLGFSDFDIVRGNFNRIESGDLLVAVLEEDVEDGRLSGRVATRGLDIGLQVEARPTLDDGTRLPLVSSRTAVHVTVLEQDALPGFADSLFSGLGVLQSILSVMLLVTGFTLPFVLIAAVLYGLFKWSQGYVRSLRKQRDDAAAEAESESHPDSVAVHGSESPEQEASVVRQWLDKDTESETRGSEGP